MWQDHQKKLQRDLDSEQTETARLICSRSCCRKADGVGRSRHFTSSWCSRRVAVLNLNLSYGEMHATILYRVPTCSNVKSFNYHSILYHHKAWDNINLWLHCTRPTRKLLLNSYSRPELKYFHAIAVMNQMLQRLLSVMMEHGKKEAIQQISGLALSFQLKLVRYLTMAWSQNYVWNAQQQRRIWVKIPVSSTCGSVVTKINAPKLTLARVDLWSVR